MLSTAQKWVESLCPYCGVGCGFLAGVEDGRVVGLEYLDDHPVSEGALCPKGNAALDIVHHQDRLLHPYKRTSDGFERISWERALDEITERLTRVREEHSAGAVGFLASAKCSNEENYVMQKWARLFGSTSVDHCARLCHASTVTGLVATLGAGAMTNPLTDTVNADCIFVIGSNFAECHPVAARWVGDALEKGTYMVVADPRVTPVVWHADLHLQHRPGSDVALVNGMMKVIVDEGLQDEQFIAQRTSGWEELKELLETVDLSEVERITGVAVADIQQAARRYANADNAVTMWSMGLTQHTSGTDNVASVANLALICGHLGRPGAGLMPLRGQNNVQGACDLGALSTVLPGYVSIGDDEARQAMAAKWGVEDLPVEPALTVVEMMHAAAEGEMRAMYIMGENPMVSDPNVGHVREGLENLDLLVVQDIFMTETAELADYVLPAALWVEKAGSYTNTERRVQWQGQVIEPPGEARADWEIICELGRRTASRAEFEFAAPEAILAQINTVVPSYGGITPERVKVLGGLCWPCPTEDHPGTPILHQDEFGTDDGLGHITPATYRDPAEKADEQYPLILTTGRLVLHHNTGSMTRRTDSLLSREARLFVEVSPSDAEQREIADGDLVRVRTRRGEAECVARTTPGIGDGVVFMPFHFPGTNLLTSDALDPKAKIPEYKVAACQIEKL